MPKNCPADIADEKPSRWQFVDLLLIDRCIEWFVVAFSARFYFTLSATLNQKELAFIWKVCKHEGEMKEV
jgi:hypothetical protein